MDINVTTGKKALKDLFGAPDSLIYDPAVQTITKGGTVTLTPTYDMPVLLDSLDIQWGDPSLTHIKIIGLAGDWYMDAEPGDSSIGFTVLSKSKEILKQAFGDAAVDDTCKVKIGANTYTGTGVAMGLHKVTGTFAIKNKEHDQVLIISGAELYASPIYTNDNKVFAIKFSGSIVADGESLNFIWAKDADKTAGA